MIQDSKILGSKLKSIILEGGLNFCDSRDHGMRGAYHWHQGFRGGCDASSGC